MGIQVPQINSVCCCSLKTATIIIGSLDLIWNLLYFISISAYGIMLALNVDRRTVAGYIGVLFLLQSLTTALVFSLVLVYGTFKEKSNFVMAWQLFQITSIINSVWNFFWNAMTVRHLDYFLGFTGFTVFNSLQILVVFSYYRKIPKNKYILHYQIPT